MTDFERAINIIFGGLSVLENDPGFCYQLYRLKDDENARIYRTVRVKKAANDAPPPTKGVFVEITVHPVLKQICVTYCSFPRESDGSQYYKHAALAYDTREAGKARSHVASYLVSGTIPQADNEFAGQS